MTQLHNDNNVCVSPGTSLTVDMWSWSLRGQTGRLLSFTQAPHPDQSCLSFYYKIYGHDTGEEPCQAPPTVLQRAEKV